MCPVEVVQNALMRDGARLTRYVRAGDGVPLLVLWDHDDAAFLTAVSILATTFRVIAPQIPSDAEHIEHLAAFADGAGLVGVRVLAHAEFAGQVMALAERGGWGDVVRCATVIANREDFEGAARLMCMTTPIDLPDLPARTTVGSPQPYNLEENEP